MPQGGTAVVNLNGTSQSLYAVKMGGSNARFANLDPDMPPSMPSEEDVPRKSEKAVLTLTGANAGSVIEGDSFFRSGSDKGLDVKVQGKSLKINNPAENINNV
ncbi:MAG: hypothetical protein CRN43_19760, partial [Candidatus Nephrothrix sp. EaCA]